MIESVVPFSGLTKADMTADKVLTAAVGKVAPAIVVGFDEQGALYVASSLGDSDMAIGLLARAQVWLCNQADSV